MIYVPKVNVSAACRLVNFDACGSIDKSGSVVGMRKIFGWPKGGQIRLGGYIYNVGPNAVQTLINARLVRGA